MFRGLRRGQSLAGHTRRGVPLKCLINATLAQLEEQLICNHQAVGSNPTLGTISGYRIMAITSAFQADDLGSIPSSRSIRKTNV